MKTLVKTFAFLVMVIAGTWLFPQRASAQNDNVSLQVFYDELSPYGTWVENPDYGYVWVPDVEDDFRPYVTNGHWVLTDYGWTWVSDFSWGWAPFHYGRWYVDPTYGNVWIPDTVWGPAWVTWRQSSGYYGWTPMGPGININISLGNSYYVPRERWVFVRDHDFMENNLNRYCMDRSSNYRIYDNSIVIRNTRFDNDRRNTYVYGPRREDVQRYSGREINSVRVRDYNKPGQTYNNGNLNIYRPQIQRRNDNGRVPAPRDISNDRNIQSGRQPNVNSSVNQREQQPSRNENGYNTGRASQPVQQQPNSNQQRYQRPEQPSRNENVYNPGRNVQPAQQQQRQQPPQQRQQPDMNQQRNQRENRPQQNAQPSEAPRQQQTKMVVNPERNKKEESNDNSSSHQPRR